MLQRPTERQIAKAWATLQEGGSNHSPPDEEAITIPRHNGATKFYEATGKGPRGKHKKKGKSKRKQAKGGGDADAGR